MLGTYLVGGTGGTLERYDPNWPVTTYSPPDSSRGTGVPMNSRSQIAVGPGGMVYVSAGNVVTATCQARRTMWVLTNRVKPGEEDMTGYVSMRVAPNGELRLHGVDQREHRVQANGEVNSRQLLPDQPVGRWRDSYARTVRRSMLVSGEPGDTRGDIDRPVSILLDDDVVEATVNAAIAQFSPTEELYYRTEAGSVRVLRPPYNAAEDIAFDGNWPARWWFSDGTFSRSGGTGLQRVRIGEGLLEVLWELNTTATTGLSVDDGRDIMDEQGVQYHSSPRGMTAFQTDGLPPPLTTCVSYQCNGYRDRWMSPE